MSTPAPPFEHNVFDERDDGTTVLIGARCGSCGRPSFPWRRQCPFDGAASETVSLGSTGSLYSYTVVRTRPPFDLPQPYALGFVDLDAIPLRVLMLLDPASVEDFAIGARLRLRAATLGVNLKGKPSRRPFFQLEQVS